MTIARAVVAVLFFALLGLVNVMLRAQQVAIMRAVERQRREIVELRRTLWAQQLELARLRSPQRVRERAHRLEQRLAGPAAAPQAARRVPLSDDRPPTAAPARRQHPHPDAPPEPHAKKPISN